MPTFVGMTGRGWRHCIQVKCDHPGGRLARMGVGQLGFLRLRVYPDVVSADQPEGGGPGLDVLADL
jgi:hypothetical protein